MHHMKGDSWCKLLSMFADASFANVLQPFVWFMWSGGYSNRFPFVAVLHPGFEFSTIVADRLWQRQQLDVLWQSQTGNLQTNPCLTPVCASIRWLFYSLARHEPTTKFNLMNTQNVSKSPHVTMPVCRKVGSRKRRHHMLLAQKRMFSQINYLEIITF